MVAFCRDCGLYGTPSDDTFVPVCGNCESMELEIYLNKNDLDKQKRKLEKKAAKAKRKKDSEDYDIQGMINAYKD